MSTASTVTISSVEQLHGTKGWFGPIDPYSAHPHLARAQNTQGGLCRQDPRAKVARSAKAGHTHLVYLVLQELEEPLTRGLASTHCACHQKGKGGR